MIRLDDVRERVEAQVPALAGRLGNAGDFANLIENNRLPQVTPAGYVLPGGLLGGRADVVTGMFRQSFQETVIVVLVCRVAGDPLGNAALDEVTPLVREVIPAVVGWAPADAIGVFELRQAELIGAKDGALVFQIDFALNDQLRITT
jgi:hypothetical protein